LTREKSEKEKRKTSEKKNQTGQNASRAEKKKNGEKTKQDAIDKSPCQEGGPPAEAAWARTSPFKKKLNEQRGGNSQKVKRILTSDNQQGGLNHSKKWKASRTADSEREPPRA